MLASISLHWVQIRLHEPFRISSGAVAVKDAIVVEHTRDGVTRWGEASPMAGAFYSRETPESTWSALERLAPAVLRDPGVDLDTVVEGEAFAKAGMVGALGLPTRDEIRPVPSGVAVGLYDTVDELLDRVRRFVDEGYQRV